jgi:hypothetical protein
MENSTLINGLVQSGFVADSHPKHVFSLTIKDILTISESGRNLLGCLLNAHMQDT